MRSLRVRLALFVSSLVVCSAALAQTPTIVKYPSGPDVQFAGTQWVVQPGGTIRWVVVIDNTTGLADLTGALRDIVGTTPPSPTPQPSCDGGICPGSNFLSLICAGPDAPDPVPSTCDPATGQLVYNTLSMPRGAVTCVEFSTVVDPAAAGTFVSNVACVQFPPPLNQTVVSRPTTSAAPSCRAGLPSEPTPGCMRLFVVSTPVLDFTVLKPAPTFDDLDGDGVLSVGDEIHWTVELTNTGTADQDGFVFDPIQNGQEFVSLDADPGGCAFNATSSQVECPVLTWTPSEVKTLRYTTRVKCSLLTEDDSSDACNQAQVCGDNDPRTNDCFFSDTDGVAPLTPTCLDFKQPSFLGSTKSVAFDDVDGDGALGTGDRLNYTITVTNDGRGTAAGTVVTDTPSPSCTDLATLDPGAGSFDGTSVTWTVGGLAPGASVNLTFSVDATDDGSGQCCNQAFVNDRTRAGCSLPGVGTDDPRQPGAPQDATCIRFGPQPVLQVTKDFRIDTDQGAPGLDNGDILEWTIVVRNVGGGSATAVDISDVLLPCQDGFDPASVVITGGGTNESTPAFPPSAGEVHVTGAGDVDGIAGGESVTVRYLTTFRGAAGGCCNQATVTFAEGSAPVDSDDPVTVAADDATCTNRTTGTVALAVSKTSRDADGDGCLEPGETVTFTIDVRASGGTATRVTLVDDVTDALNLVTITDAGGGTIDPAAESITWTIGDIADGASERREWTGEVACDAADGAGFSDEATASSTNPATGADGLTNRVAAPVLEVAKTATVDDTNGNGALDPGEAVVFDVVVTNSGSCASNAVTVSDQLDADLDFGTATASNGGLVDGAGLVTWDGTTTPALGSIAAGGSVSLSIRAAANGGADDSVANQADATTKLDSTRCPSIDAADAITPIPIGGSGAQLQVSKTAADQDLDGCFEPGETVTFTITVTGGPATGVTLADVVTDAGGIATFVSASDGGTFDAGTNTVNWALPDVVPGAAVVRTWQATIGCTAADRASFSDTATASAADAASGSDSVTTTVNAAVLLVDKTSAYADADGDSTLDPGEVVTFTIQVLNSGSCAADSVAITDAIDVDLDAASLVISDGGQAAGANVTWDGTTTPGLVSIGPGARVTVTVAGTALDPAANPAPGADANVDNSATAAAAAAFSCPAVTDTDALVADLDPALNEVFEIGGAPPATQLLRNDEIACKATAFATLIGVPNVVGPGEGVGLNATHPRTTAQTVGVPGTLTFPGDATPSASADTCPEGAASGVLVFYELRGSSAPMTVRKSGTDVVVSW